MKKILLLFLLTAGSAFPFMNQQKSKYHSPKEALHEKLIKRLSVLDFATLLQSPIPQQIIDEAQKIKPTNDTSSPEDFLAIWPLEGKNAFTTFLDEQNLGGHIKKFRNKFLTPMWHIFQLSQIIKTTPKIGRKSPRIKTQLKELTTIWQQILKIMPQEELEAKIETVKNANDLLTKLYAARVTAFLATLPPLTKNQRLIRKLDIVDFLNNYNMDLIFTHPVLVKMNVVDPKSADEILLPIYKDIQGLWFLRSMKAHFWPAQIPLRDDYRLRLNAAFKAFDVHSHIKRIIKRMRNLTIQSAQQALEQIVSSVTIIPETINEVTQKIGPFRQTSDELTTAAEPVLKKLTELQDTVHAFVEGMEETSSPQTEPRAPTTTKPKPVASTSASFSMGQPVVPAAPSETTTSPISASPTNSPAGLPASPSSSPAPAPLPFAAKLNPTTGQPARPITSTPLSQ